MPHSASAAKRLRQNEKRRLANKSRSTELKTLHKQIEREVHDGHIDKAETLFRRYAKRLDQAASSSNIHRKNASRHQGRMAQRIAVAKANPIAAKPASAKPAAVKV